uniref:C2H2-type domain-containing protein n=1 Tax=Graphocephala atropunctata TaxID=36148 RepID=A0A1B6L061_9HEMI
MGDTQLSCYSFKTKVGNNKASIDTNLRGGTSSVFSTDSEGLRVSQNKSRSQEENTCNEQDLSRTDCLLNPKIEEKPLLDEPETSSSSDNSVKEESSGVQSIWLPSSTIKKEEDVEEKAPESDGSDSHEENDDMEDDSEAEMDNDSDGGAYHLAEVSYGEEDNDDDEDSDKAETKGAVSTLGNSHDNNKASTTRLENIEINSSREAKRFLASDFIIRRKNEKVIDSESGRVHYRNFECLLCGYKTSQRSSLIEHIHKHTGDRIQHCLHCNKQFRYKSYLMQHITVYHTDMAQFSCKLCDRKFAKESEYERHNRTHSDERPFPCPHCTYRARNQGTLKDHLRVHTGEKPYECSLCSYKCAYSTLLKRHIASQHEEKTYECQLCNYKGKLLRNYNAHIKRHKRDKQFFCEKCDYKSYERDLLKSHIKNVHSNASSSYACTMCQARFRQERSLKRHLAEHTDQNSYNCTLCNRSFNRMRNLTHHQKRWHSKEDTTKYIKTK